MGHHSVNPVLQNQVRHFPRMQNLSPIASVKVGIRARMAVLARLASPANSKIFLEVRLVRIVEQVPTCRQLLQISRVLVRNARRIRIRPQAARQRVRARVSWDSILVMAVV